MARTLDNLRRAAGVKQEQLVQETGIPRATLQRILTGTAVPDDHRLDAILKVIGATHRDLVPVEDRETFDVPIYDIEVAAGPGRLLNSEEPVGSWPFPREWVVRNFGADADLALLSVAGDSQEPELRSGDSVMINLRANRVRDGMHVIRLGEALAIKRLVPEGRSVRLVSANPVYPDVVIDLDRDRDGFEVVGRAVWAGKLL